ncbi:MAG: WD40/YVTN/BNR-like repeat-containing protein [Candidatus Heimdallarchaeaceae archaeon]
MNNLWFIGIEGILDSETNPIPEVPFQGRLVHHGQVKDYKVAVIVDRKEIWTFINNTWEKVVESNLVLNCLLWTQEDKLLVGTAEARLAWVKDNELEFIENFDQVKERPLWDTPWGGPPDSRSLALGSDGSIYVDIHVGWIAKSYDNGKTWESTRTETLEKDVHQVSANPRNSNIVFTATAYGFYISFDKAESFVRKWDKKRQNYQRATICFPDKDVYLATVANSFAGGNARIYRTEDDGDTWEQAEGLPEGIKLNINTYQVNTFNNGRALAIIENKHIYESEDYGKNWDQILVEFPKTYQILVVN